MPNYLYQCKKCNNKFRETTPVAERDNVNCTCGEHAERIFEGTTSFSLHGLSTAQKGIKSDLTEVNKLERIAAYDGGARNADDQQRLKREIDKLKYTE